MLEAIVAVYRDWGIGADGSQPLVLQADRKQFRAVTGDSAVIVGRKTLADFPGGKPLKGRKNIVLTRQELHIPGALVVHSTTQALAVARDFDRCLVIGGASVYLELFPHIQHVYVTKIDAQPHCDAFFPDLDADPDFTCTAAGPLLEEDGVAYQFLEYSRK